MVAVVVGVAVVVAVVVGVAVVVAVVVSMNTPQHIEALTVEQVELLRSLPQLVMPLPAGHLLGVLEPMGLVRWQVPPIYSDGAIWHRTPAADTLLATLDSHTATAVKEERERVLVEIDAAAWALAECQGFSVSIFEDDPYEFVQVTDDDTGQAYNAATLTEALFTAKDETNA